jgi:cell shape-determining protein MreD
MIIIFTLYIFDIFVKNKYFILSLCFVAGMLFDYMNFFPIGKSSITLLVIFYTYYLYEKKFKTNNLLFKIGAFLISAIIFSVVSAKFNFSQLFWWTLFYVLVVFIRQTYGK